MSSGFSVGRSSLRGDYESSAEEVEVKEKSASLSSLPMGSFLGFVDEPDLRSSGLFELTFEVLEQSPENADSGGGKRQKLVESCESVGRAMLGGAPGLREASDAISVPIGSKRERVSISPSKTGALVASLPGEGFLPLRPLPILVLNPERTFSSEASRAAFHFLLQTGENLETCRESFKSLIRPFAVVGRNKRDIYSKALEAPRKNRYTDILPYDPYLVPNLPYYLNASQVLLPSGHQTVVAQAPLPHTFTDFWEMIYSSMGESAETQVVMLTNFIEKRVVKAHCYWPGAVGDSEVFDEKLRVALSKKEVLSAGLTRRTFTIEIKNPVTGEFEGAKIVKHLHYTEWPDHGVPENTGTFLMILEALSKHRSQSPGVPPVIHCSAGVGRAGTLTSAEAFLLMVKQGMALRDEVGTLPGLVNQLRQYRMHLVQTAEQMQFLHQVCADVLETGFTQRVDEVASCGSTLSHA